MHYDEGALSELRCPDVPVVDLFRSLVNTVGIKIL